MLKLNCFKLFSKQLKSALSALLQNARNDQNALVDSFIFTIFLFLLCINMRCSNANNRHYVVIEKVNKNYSLYFEIDSCYTMSNDPLVSWGVTKSMKYLSLCDTLLLSLYMQPNIDTINFSYFSAKDEKLLVNKFNILSGLDGYNIEKYTKYKYGQYHVFSDTLDAKYNLYSGAYIYPNSRDLFGYYLWSKSSRPCPCEKLHESLIKSLDLRKQ